MGRSNTANSGSTYYDLLIQVVSADANQYTLRAVIYLQSLNVSDSSNSLTVGGNFSRSGALHIDGVYNYVPVWTQDISVARVVGANQTITVNASWSGVNYWGTTLSASEPFVVPAKESAPPVVPASAPYGYSARNITTTSAYTTNVNVASDGGSSLNNLWVRWFSAGGTLINQRQMGTFTDGFMDGLTRGTSYQFDVAVGNGVYWSAFGSRATFKTLPLPPVIGTGYSVSSITRDSAIVGNLSITDTGGATVNNVRVQHNTSASTSGATVVTRGSWGNVTLSGLPAGAVRHYRVAAANSAGFGSYGPWKSFTTLTGTPSSPAAPTFSSVTDTGMTMEWVAPAMNGATLINYSYGLSLTSDFATLVRSGSTSDLSIAFTGLLPGTRYHGRVRANATPSNSGFGVAQQLTTGITPESGLRIYTFIAGDRYELAPYACVAGEIEPVRLMWQNGDTLQTE